MPAPRRGVPPERDDRFGRDVAAPVGGDSLHRDLEGGAYAPRHGRFGRPELRRGESRREEHPHQRRGGAQQQGREPRQHESPCGEPQGQCETVGQRDARREGDEDFQHRHPVEPCE